MLSFETGDLVWLHLRKDRFPELRKSKLMPRADGPFKIVKKINDNAYKLELPADFGVSPTFNVSDLKPYLGEEDELESRTTPIQEGEDDEDIDHNDKDSSHTIVPGPITRSRARRLNHEVRSFLTVHSYEAKDGMLLNGDILTLRNMGEAPLDQPCEEEASPQVNSDSTSNPDFGSVSAKHLFVNRA